MRNDLSGPISGETSENMIKALKLEINKSTFNCRWNKNGPSNEEVKKQLNTLLDDKTTEISLSDDLSQPVISTVTKFKYDATLETTVNYSTSPDLKKLINVYASKDYVILKEINVGNIVNPKFEITKVRTPILFGSCSVE
jgi:hypothetical protein